MYVSVFLCSSESKLKCMDTKCTEANVQCAMYNTYNAVSIDYFTLFPTVSWVSNKSGFKFLKETVAWE